MDAPDENKKEIEKLVTDILEAEVSLDKAAADELAATKAENAKALKESLAQLKAEASEVIAAKEAWKKLSAADKKKRQQQWAAAQEEDSKKFMVDEIEFLSGKLGLDGKELEELKKKKLSAADKKK